MLILITVLNALNYIINFLLLSIQLPQTTFKGRVFMTHATKAIYRWLLSDYIKVRYYNIVTVTH